MGHGMGWPEQVAVQERGGRVGLSDGHLKLTSPDVGVLAPCDAHLLSFPGPALLTAAQGASTAHCGS